MKHLTWVKHGRKFSHADEGEPNKVTYRSAIGEKNVDVNGDESVYAPYVQSGNGLRYGDARCNFADGYQEIKQLGRTIISRSRIFIQRDISGTWTDVPHGVPTRNIQHDYPRDGRCTAYLDFPDIQGYAQGSRFQTGIEVGGNDRQTLGFRLRSPIAGTFRLEWVLDIPDNIALSWIYIPTSPVDPTPIRIGGRIGNIEIRWSRKEAPYRDATVEDDGQGGKILHIFMGPYDLEAMEFLVIYPDTFGPTAIAAEADDGYEQATENDWYTSGLSLGNPGSDIFHIGLRWGGITIVEADTVTEAIIRLYQDDAGATSEVIECDWMAHNVADSDAFSLSLWPSTCPHTTAVVAADFNPDTSGYPVWIVSGNLKDIVTEVIATSSGLSNEHIAFILYTNSAASNCYVSFHGYSEANPATLEITYTLGGGESVPKRMLLLGVGAVVEKKLRNRKNEIAINGIVPK